MSRIIISRIERTREWINKNLTLSNDEKRLLINPYTNESSDADALKARLKKEIINEAGGKLRATVLGKIGEGTKIHHLFITYIILHKPDGTEGILYLSAYDGCGSAKWNRYHRSAPTVLDTMDESKITCKKCLK